MPAPRWPNDKASDTPTPRRLTQYESTGLSFPQLSTISVRKLKSTSDTRGALLVMSEKVIPIGTLRLEKLDVHEKTSHQTSTKAGIRIGMLYLPIYPKNEGHLIPDCSAIDFTMKFGPLPMYVIAPKNTEPSDIA